MVGDCLDFFLMVKDSFSLSGAAGYASSQLKSKLLWVGPFLDLYWQQFSSLKTQNTLIKDTWNSSPLTFDIFICIRVLLIQARASEYRLIDVHLVENLENNIFFYLELTGNNKKYFLSSSALFYRDSWILTVGGIREWNNWLHNRMIFYSNISFAMSDLSVIKFNFSIDLSYT